MEECEALCTRIGIMTAGRMRCLGTVQHLKNRFGAGYCLDMRLQPARLEDAVAFVQRQCPTAQLLNRTADRISFSIPQQGLDLPALFAAVESNRSTLQIDDYSLSQTTLEQVFVALAQQNTEQQLR
ncbi:TPA: ATP-binding cassette sub- A member 2 [Trebouxia sp. C0004]